MGAPGEIWLESHGGAVAGAAAAGGGAGGGAGAARSTLPRRMKCAWGSSGCSRTTELMMVAETPPVVEPMRCESATKSSPSSHHAHRVRCAQGRAGQSPRDGYAYTYAYIYMPVPWAERAGAPPRQRRGRRGRARLWPAAGRGCHVAGGDEAAGRTGVEAVLLEAARPQREQRHLPPRSRSRSRRRRRIEGIRAPRPPRQRAQQQPHAQARGLRALHSVRAGGGGGSIGLRSKLVVTWGADA
jgi:hypothetical protein